MNNFKINSLMYLYVSFDTSKLEKSIIFNDSHPLKIQSIVITFDVIKLDKFAEVKLLHSLNILSIYSSFSVLKLEISIHFYDSQLENKWPKLVIFDAPKTDKFNDINDLQSQSILDISFK